MKKLLKAILIASMVLVSTTASAAGSAVVKKTHKIDSYVTLSASATTVDEGGKVSLTAVTPKYGSAIVGELTVWSGQGVAPAATSLNANGNYESSTVFTAPHVTKDTDFVISYTIATTAGKSGVVFMGTDSTVVTVNDVPVTVTVERLIIRVTAKRTTGNAGNTDASQNTQITLTGQYELSNGATGTISQFNVTIPATDVDGVKTTDVQVKDPANAVDQTVRVEVSKTLQVGDQLTVEPK